MKRFVLTIAVAFLSACGLEQAGMEEHSSSDGIWRGPSYGKHYSGTVYAVGLDYPDGYDWRVDTRKGKVKCSMVMFADGIPVLKIPVGDAYSGIRPHLPEVPLRETLARPIEEWDGILVNDFEETVFARYPELAAIKRSLYDSGAAYASMSGSGSALFALYRM